MGTRFVSTGCSFWEVLVAVAFWVSGGVFRWRYPRWSLLNDLLLREFAADLGLGLGNCLSWRLALFFGALGGNAYD